MPAERNDATAVRHAAAGRSALRLVRALVLPVVLAALLAGPAPALAHARLERSVPATGATLATAPSSIELEFNELLDEEFNDVAVFRATSDGAPADEHSFTSGKPRVDPAHRTHLSAPVGPLPPGAYVVRWKVLSRDGHSARGQVLFRVGTAG
jgi:methionine-rich copper-binding protein CopC